MDSTGKKASKKTENKQFFPDEIITNILTRLPPKSVARCQLVCRGWKDLTLPRDFVDLIFKNSIPTILVTNPRRFSRLDLFVIDNWWELVGNKPTIRRFPSHSGKFPNTSRPLFSHAGIIVLDQNTFPSSEANFIILNPARSSRECVRITLSKKLKKSHIYGVYFHPLLKEYCSLWEIHASDYHHPKQIMYTILNLGSNPFLRTVSYPFSNRAKIWGVSPIFVNNCLYWLLETLPEFTYGVRNDIMEFNIISEEFMIIPCPVPLDIKCEYFRIRLLNIDGVLSFLVIFPRKITIWKLENHAERLWTVAEYTLSIDLCQSIVARGEVDVVDGKLALLSVGRLLVCNLMEGSKDYHKRIYNDDVLFLSHQMSLASLSNCTHTMTIDVDDKVVAACLSTIHIQKQYNQD